MSDCGSLHFTRVNGLLMGRRLETGGANTYTQRPIPGLLTGQAGREPPQAARKGGTA